MTYFWKMNEDENILGKKQVVTLLQGLKHSKTEGINLNYSRGCDWTDTIETVVSQGGDERAWEYKVQHRKVDAHENADKAEALAMAENADVIIAAMGENVMLCGENRDRQGLRLPGQQEQYIEELLATGKPVVLVLFGGRAQVISKIADRCAAIIQAWYPGEEGGNALANILYGKVSPSAKLSVSYPNVELNEPICYNYSEKQDSRVAWPFGYGLSYTTFKYSNLKVTTKAKTNDESINISFDVTNTGTMDADEIAQVYLSPTQQNQNIRPIQLQGFSRLSLKKGETKTVTIKMFIDQFGYYTNNGKRQWNIAPGEYIIKVGASSQDIKLKQNIKLSGDTIIKPLRDNYFAEVKVKG